MVGLATEALESPIASSLFLSVRGCTLEQAQCICVLIQEQLDFLVVPI
jgi:hypothetical protein